jgi:hypothetical protein
MLLEYQLCELERCGAQVLFQCFGVAQIEA